MPCVAHLMLVMLRLTLFVAHLMLVMLRLTPFVAHLILVMVLNMPEQCSFQDMLFHMLFMPKYAEKCTASRMDISLVLYDWHLRSFTSILAHSPKKELFSWKVGIEPSSTPFLGFQGSRGSRRNQKVIDQLFIVPLIYPNFLTCVEGFLWMGSQGVLSTAGSLLSRDCQNASESVSLPHGVCGRKK